MSAGNFSFFLTCADTYSGVAATYYKIGDAAATLYPGGSIPVNALASTAVQYWSVDAAGNAETAKIATIKIDSGAPVTTASGVPAGWTNSDVDVALTATSAHFTIEHIYWHVGSAVDGFYASPIHVATEGTTVLHYHATDSKPSTEVDRFVTIRIDKTLPSSSVSGIPAVPTGSVTFSLSGSDALSGLAALRYTLGGGAVQTYTTPVTVSSGSTTLEYWAVDNAGNVGVHHSVAITASKPTCTLTIKTTKTSAALGTQFILSGLITPSPAAIGKLMHVDIKKPGKAYWSYSSARVVYSASGVAAWQYKYTLTRTMAKGVYAYRAVYDGADFKYGVSSSISVKVY